MNLPKKTLAVVDIEQASPVAFMNVYSAGDLWIKVVGCKGCKLERRRGCCGTCEKKTVDGKCGLHKPERNGVSKKPLMCVVQPTPNKCKVGCALVYYCQKGENVRKFRHVSDKGGQFRWD